MVAKVAELCGTVGLSVVLEQLIGAPDSKGLEAEQAWSQTSPAWIPVLGADIAVADAWGVPPFLAEEVVAAAVSTLFGAVSPDESLQIRHGRPARVPPVKQH